MGWRERDYARLRDDERRALFGPSSGRSRATHGRRRGITRASASLLATLAFSAVAVAFGSDHLKIPIHLSKKAEQTVTPTRHSISKLVVIRWQAADITPAATAGRICVSMREHGRVCATYAIGEKPADALTRRLEGAGLRVESSG